MSSSAQSTTCLHSTFDENRWVMQVRRIIDEEIEDDMEIDVSIFNVPKALRDTNPNAYTPQLVALGPYHYWRPELQEMERYKISLAKRFQNKKQSTKLHTFVDRLMTLEYEIRAHYHKYLDINGETLAWMMAIDSAFIVEISDINSIKEENVLCQVPSKMVDYARRKSVYNAILRDIIMLENQIPLLILREMLGYWLHSSNVVNKTLDSILVGFCMDLSPFKMMNWVQIRHSNCDHILDFLYKNLVPRVEEIIEMNDHVGDDIITDEERKLCKLLTQLKEFLGRISFKAISKLSHIYISSLPGFTILTTFFIPKETNQGNFRDRINSQSIQDNKPPLVEEIMIPSVIELSKSGIIFLPTNNGDIMSIAFDEGSKKFYLPTISLDVNTEVLLRNLVAYEASSTLGPLVFTRYIELMNGIIDTNDDVRLLKESGIIHNYLKSDEEVANLWNGMSKSLRLTNVPFLDEVIENVNRYYEGNWKVILSKFIKAYIINSWEIFAFLFVCLILLLLFVQVFSSLLYTPRMIVPHPRGRI